MTACHPVTFMHKETLQCLFHCAATSVAMIDHVIARVMAGVSDDLLQLLQTFTKHSNCFLGAAVCSL